MQNKAPEIEAGYLTKTTTVKNSLLSNRYKRKKISSLRHSSCTVWNFLTDCMEKILWEAKNFKLVKKCIVFVEYEALPWYSTWIMVPVLCKTNSAQSHNIFFKAIYYLYIYHKKFFMHFWPPARVRMQRPCYFCFNLLKPSGFFTYHQV